MIGKHLHSFLNYDAKSMHHLREEHFKSVRNCCNTVKPCIRKKLNELSDKIQVYSISISFYAHTHVIDS